MSQWRSKALGNAVHNLGAAGCHRAPSRSIGRCSTDAPVVSTPIVHIQSRLGPCNLRLRASELDKRPLDHEMSRIAVTSFGEAEVAEHAAQIDEHSHAAAQNGAVS